MDWRVDFAEVFADRKGFDVVVANPPYVRQEKIGESKSDLRKLYAASTVARSDLYCYFYVRALQLLRDGGVQVFVCSNSWLDVGYGAKLQEHLLKNARVDAVYESAVERQFSTAQINTIISVISKSLSEDGDGIRFVSLRDEFEVAILDASKRRDTLMSKSDLIDASLGSPDAQGRRKFVGDKWGAKYLRAPDIYRTVMTKGEGKLIRVGEVSSVRYGIKTGANPFFYVTPETISRWGIEERYLKPVMTSPQVSRRILLTDDVLNRKLFWCNDDREDIAGSAALEYIKYGETKGFNERRSTSARKRWYGLGNVPPCRLGMNLLIESTARTFISLEPIHFTNNFLVFWTGDVDDTRFCAAMNSTFYQLVMNTEGRANFGEGVLEIQTYEVAKSPIVDPQFLPTIDIDLFASNSWDVMNPSPERRLIDDAVFDVLSLTQGERDGVYEGVRELVENRRRRAKSI